MENRTVKAQLIPWATGRGSSADERRTVVLDDASHLSDVLGSDLVDASTIVLAPDVDAHDDPRVAGYAGSLAEPGEEMSFGDDFFLQIQDYATSQYMSLLGPTLIRVTGEEDLEVFLQDADDALASGTFPDFGTHPAVQLADQVALGGPTEGDGPRRRLHVDADGQVSLSPAGAVLGGIGDPMTVLEEAWQTRNAASSAPCAVALGRVVPEDVRCAALAARPWLRRYLTALDSVRELRVRGVLDTRVSGFGGRLLPQLDGEPDLSGESTPLLLWNEHAAFVRDPVAGRTFSVDRRAGGLVEALLTRGSADAASDVADRAELDEVRATFESAGVALVGGAAR